MVPDDNRDARVGSRFGRYEIRAVLGRGGMGTVYEAYDTVKDRLVALKLLAAHLSGDDNFRERFRRESHAAAQLQEPHVIPIHDWGEVDGTLYIDMRLVKGVDLRTLINDGPLPPDRAVAINSQIAAALDAAHAANLIHRDVKPENILVTGADFAYLVDFGIASSHGDPRLTVDSGAVGTLSYMAPERFDGKPPTSAVDIYALGCVLHESLTGAAPYPTNTPQQAVLGHAMTPPPVPSRLNPAVPASFDSVIARALAKEPDERYGSAGAFGRAAQRALRPPATEPTFTPAGHQAEPTVVGPQLYPPQPPPRADVPPPPPPHRSGVLYRQEGPGRERRRWLVPSLIAASLTVTVVAVGVAVVLFQTQRHDRVTDTSVNAQVDAPVTTQAADTTEPTFRSPLTRPQSPSPRPLALPPLVQGPDATGQACDQGFTTPVATGWGSRAGRGTPETSCRFAQNVLDAYWARYSTASRERRMVNAAGSVPCDTTGGPCAGTLFIMECAALGSDDWITCTGGDNARVYLY